MSEENELRALINEWWAAHILGHRKRGTDVLEGEGVSDYKIAGVVEFRAARADIALRLAKCLAFQIRQDPCFNTNERTVFTWRIRWIEKAEAVR